MKYLFSSLLIIALAFSICGCKSSKSKKGTLTIEPLAQLKNVETRYVTTSEAGKNTVRARIGWINVVSKNDKSIKSYEFTVGNYRFREDLFTPATKPAKSVYPSIGSLVQGLRPYVQDMPVGFVLTLDGELPNVNDSEPPDYFKSFVREFQIAMDFEKIKYAIIIPQNWEIDK